MEEVHLSSGIECQTLDSNIMSPHFANDLFDIIKRQKDFSLYLAISQIEATVKMKFKVKVIRTYLQNLSSFASLYFQRERLKWH